LEPPWARSDLSGNEKSARTRENGAHDGIPLEAGDSDRAPAQYEIAQSTGSGPAGRNRPMEHTFDNNEGNSVYFYVLIARRRLSRGTQRRSAERTIMRHEALPVSIGRAFKMLQFTSWILREDQPRDVRAVLAGPESGRRNAPQAPLSPSVSKTPPACSV